MDREQPAGKQPGIEIPITSGSDDPPEEEFEEMTEPEAEEKMRETEQDVDQFIREAEDLKQRIEELEDGLKRERADFVNYRQRATREAQRATTSAKRQLVSEISSLVEAFYHTDRGLNEHPDFDALKEAYSIVRTEMAKLLENWGIVITGMEGERFDPARHEALFQQEDPDVDAPTVLQVVKPGVALGDAVLKPAKVVVACPPNKAPCDNEDPGDNVQPDKE